MNSISTPRTISEDVQKSDYKCPLHQLNTHGITECIAFNKLNPSMKRLIASSHRLCSKCLGNHFAESCARELFCNICNSPDHATLLHRDY